MKKIFTLLLFTLLSVISVQAGTYYMAGTGTSSNNWCCGKSWNAAGCQMQNSSSPYTYETTVPAGTYQFKVTDGSWNNTWGYSNVDSSTSTSGYTESGGNVKFSVASEATINVSFNSSTKKITLISTVPFGDPTYSVWTVVGESGLLGSSWNTGDTNNDMTLVGSNYVLVKEGLSLSKKDYEYKIVANHAWGVKECPSSGNAKLSISEAGTYNVTFTVSPDGKTYSGVAEKQTPTPTQHTVTIGGYKSATGVDDFTLTSSDNDTFTGSVNLSSEYQFKVDLDGTKYSDNTHYTGTATKTLQTSKGRNYVDVSLSGEYQFQFVVSTKALTITYPSLVNPTTVAVSSADANQGTVSPAEVQVDATHPASITATPKSGYIFDTWALGGSAVIDDGYALTDATIKVKSDGTTNPGTAQASFVVDPNAVTVYFANTAGWSDDNVKAYVWYDDTHHEADWPGTKMSKTDIVQKGYTLYKHTFSNVYTKIIFSNNGGNQSANLTVTGNEGKYFHYADNQWYDIEAYKTVNVSSEDTDKGTVSPASVSVGATTSAEITATATDGYAFDHWTLTNASFADGYSATDRVAKIISDGTDTEGSAVASFRVAQKITLYFANSEGWADVAAYLWDANDGQLAPWTGTQMTATDTIQKGGYTLYAIRHVDEKYINVVFNDNVTSSGNKTADLTTSGHGGMYYYKPDLAWYNIEPFTTINVSSADTQLGSVSKSTVYVSENTSEQITATPKSGCIFTGWTLTGCTTEDELTSATITIKGDGSSETGTAVASFEADPEAKTIYLVNVYGWAQPKAYIWDPTTLASWPGSDMTKTAQTATSEEYEVWSFSYSGTYNKCIFNCGDGSCQTGDLDITDGKPYYYPVTNQWYATLADIPDPVFITLTYVNKAGWDNVYIQMTGGSGPSMNWPGVSMTKSDDKKWGIDVYTYTFIKDLYTGYTINKGNGEGQIVKTVTADKYVHYNGARFATLDDIPLPYLKGTFNSWSTTENVFALDSTGVGSTTVGPLEAGSVPEFKVTDIEDLGNNGTMTSENCTGWTMSTSTNNCKLQVRNKGAFTFTYDVKTSKLSATYPEYTDDIDMIVTNASGEDTIPMTKNPQADKEYYKYGLVLRTGDVVTFFDHYGLKAFKAKVIDPTGSMTNVAEITDNGLEITQSIETNFYLILEKDNDKVQLQHGSKILDQIAPNAFLSDIDGSTKDLKVIRPMSSAYYNTLCLPFDLDEDQLSTIYPGATVAKLTYAEVEKVGDKYKTYLRFTKVKNIEAGMPYFIQPGADISAEPMTFEGVTIDKEAKTQEDVELVKAYGILAPTELQKDAYNYLFLGANNTLFYPNVTGTMKAMRAYFVVNEGASPALTQGLSPKQLKAYPALMSIEDPIDEELTTDVDEANADAETKPYKIFTDDNGIVIVIDGALYNLAGQPIK